MSARKLPLNGKLASRPGAQPSKSKLRAPNKSLQKLLTSVYDRFQRLDDRKANATARQDFVFHMTDWLDDLHRLVAIYEHPEKFSREDASDIAGFLYHVIPHLKAAGRLLLDDIPDAFDPDTAKQ
jgi:hypothetical protein